VATGRAGGSLLEQLALEQVAIWRRRLKAGDVLWRDNVTGLVYDRGKEYNPRIVALAVERWRPSAPVVYGEGDVVNLSGLNRRLTQGGADAVIAALVGYFVEETGRLGGDAAFIRKGGDEFGLTVVGVPLRQVQAAIDRASVRVIRYLREKGLESVPHTKAGMPLGTGVRFALVEYDPRIHASANELRRDAELDVEEMKLRTGPWAKKD